MGCLHPGTPQAHESQQRWMSHRRLQGRLADYDRQERGRKRTAKQNREEKVEIKLATVWH
eukprot:1140804-Pelagomonas_calceolata.AAC.3